MSQNKVSEWIRSALENEDISDYHIKIHEDTGKSTGYWGQMIFVTVTGKTRSGDKNTLHLVIKSAPSSPLLRSQVPVRQLFEKEIEIYHEVIPAFKNLQRELGLNLLNFVPKCYLSLAEENEEIVILRNMKPDGFELCNRLIPLDFDYIKLVLQAFGRWHAFSFALKRKQPDVFASLVRNKRHMFPYYIWKVGINDIVYRFFDEVRNVWKQEKEIAENLTLSQNDVDFIFGNSFLEGVDELVILHGDGWTNNLLFKHQVEFKSPSAVCFIDFQCSGLASPIMDLSYFIYSCVDNEVYKDVKELLSVYYSSLSDSLQQLGCDPVEVFPYERLVEHWKKFSKYGLILVTFLFKFLLAEGDEAPNFAEGAEQGRDFMENFNFSIANESVYHKRSKDNFLHYLRNLKES